MFKFFRRKKAAPETPAPAPATEQVPAAASIPVSVPPAAPAAAPSPAPTPAPVTQAPPAPTPASAPAAAPVAAQPALAEAPSVPATTAQTSAAPSAPATATEAAPAAISANVNADRAVASPATPESAKTAPEPEAPAAPAAPVIAAAAAAPQAAPAAQEQASASEQIDTPRVGWFARLKGGLAKTGHSITTVFTGTQIDDALYEDLETALLLADTGVAATEFLLQDLKRRVKQARASNPQQVRELLRTAVTDLLAPLEKTLVVGAYHPTVMMIAGVNGAGKTTSIGKLTKHMADAGASVLLAAADTFRAAAREQLEVWADRNRVEIISQQGADPAAVSFDAVAAGRARDKDVVLVDTAGRLPTQKHLMEELAKIRRVITKADLTAPHEVLLVIDGNTGQNALAQVKAFDDVIKLTGLIVTKLDGTAKGGVLCAIAREHPIPVYFIGIGEALEDLQTFRAAEFARALTD